MFVSICFFSNFTFIHPFPGALSLTVLLNYVQLCFVELFDAFRLLFISIWGWRLIEQIELALLILVDLGLTKPIEFWRNWK